MDYDPVKEQAVQSEKHASPSEGSKKITMIASLENMLNANRALTFQGISGNPLNFSNAARKL